MMMSANLSPLLERKSCLMNSRSRDISLSLSGRGFENSVGKDLTYLDSRVVHNFLRRFQLPLISNRCRILPDQGHPASRRDCRLTVLTQFGHERKIVSATTHTTKHVVPRLV